MVHFRKLFELAAGPLEEAGDGFTGRPYPVGKWKYSMEEINQFSQFLHRNMIAFPRYYENRILLSFSAKMVDPRKQDPEKSSFIAFDQKGNIAVNISKADYDQYKDRFTFDQLCQSLSLVFKDFFDKFRTGRKEEIVSIMEAFEPKWVKPVQIGTLILLSLTFLIIFIIYLVGK